MRFLIFSISLFIFFSCKNEKHKESKIKNNTEIKSILDDPIKEVELIVYMDQLRLRKGPTVEDEEVMRIPENIVVKFKGETSKNFTKIKLRGVQMNAPWLKVTLKNNQEGWLYAGGVKPKTNNTSEATSILDGIYLNSFFEKKLVDRIKSFSSDWNNAKTSDQLAKAYMEGEKIQELINKSLQSKVDIDDPGNLLDMTWLERAMVGFTNSLVAEATEFYLFKDFKKMNEQAIQTKGEEDDYFFDLQFKANNLDSIEYFFKSWFLQTWDYGGHSLLGQSIHYEILTDMDDQLKNSKIFEQPILKLKEELMDDILNTELSYWEPQEDIVQEMTAIVSRDFDFLTKEDKIALKSRLEMFKNFEANKIELNNRNQ